MFYDTFAFLCKQKGLSPSRAAVEAKISKSLVTKWKSNGTEVPSPEVLKKLSNFFGVTPDYLLGYDIQSQIDTLSEQIEQIKIEIRSASAERIEDLESTLAILEDSYDDLVFARSVSSKIENEDKKSSPGELIPTERESRILKALRAKSPAEQKALLTLLGIEE